MTAPVPLPPPRVVVKGASPYVVLAGPVIVRVAWAALLTVRLMAALVLVPCSASPA